MNTEKDLSLLVTRLEKLERQNRFFKILGVMILLTAGAALFMGARPLDVLQAERFVLVDSSGQAMATLGPDGSGRPGLSIKDKATGKERVWLGMWGASEAGLGFFDKNGKERSRLGITTDDVTRLSFYDAADNQKAWFGITNGGQPTVSLWAAGLKQRAWIGISAGNKPAVAKCGPEGKARVWRCGLNNQRPGLSMR